MELSRRFKDRPKTPKEEVIYWSEYVIKHKGAHHLKSAALQLAWYQYFLIDVLVTVVFVFLASIGIIFFTLKTVKRRFCTFTKSKRE